ncbi:MAG TPA: LysM domain-containing protein [Gammaproteobacteria bacterium]
MFNAHSPLVRSVSIVMATALGVIAASTGVAQAPAGDTAASAREAPVLNPRHPESYVVQRGDTLWDIAALFLRDPWYWPEIWQINPQVENPHLIYPGDVLSLAYVDGRPVIQLERASANDVRLSPRVRSEPIEEAIPTIPFEAVRAFLSRPAVLDPDELDTLPYIVAQEKGLMGSAGRSVYVRGTDDAEVGSVYDLVHLGDPLIDPDDDEVVGYEGLYVGRGRIRRAGDPATLLLTESEREALVGDYLIEEETIPPMDFLPRAPEQPIDGRIISVIDGISLIGQYQVVVINRGARDGLEPGHVLRAFRSGDVIVDRVRGRRRFGEKVKLPDEPAGLMMTFRTFDRISYALVMEATSEIRVLDAVRNP